MSTNISYKISFLGVPTVAQREWTQVVPMRMQVGSLALLSVLKDPVLGVTGSGVAVAVV